MAGVTKLPEQSSPSLSLNGRVAIITGASRGIGHAVATHLASLGAKLVLNYASKSTEANLLASQINSSTSSSETQPPRAIAVQADVSDPVQVKSLFDQAEKAFGSSIHILVNCAGILDSKYPTVANTTVEDWDMTFSVNTKGAFLLCREAANRLTRGGSGSGSGSGSDGGGRIIMITSSVVGGLYPGYSAYAASKAAVETMVKILAKELKGTGITANCIAPGPIATELFFAGKTEEMVKRLVDGCPLERLGQPKDVMSLVGFMASDAGEWINGQVVRINGGAVV